MRFSAKAKGLVWIVTLLAAIVVGICAVLKKPAKIFAEQSGVTHGNNSPVNQAGRDVIINYGAEKRVEEHIPALPWMEIKTLTGLGLPTGDSEITIEATQKYREHRLFIHNTNNVDLRNLNVVVQLPEPAIETIPKGIGQLRPQSPPGVHVKWIPKRERPDVIGSVSSIGQLPPKSEWQLEIDVLPAFRLIEIPFLTISSQSDEMLASIRRSLSAMGQSIFTDTNSRQLTDFILGDFQFFSSGSWSTQEFCMGILFDPTNRTITTLPPEGTTTNWTIRRRVSIP